MKKTIISLSAALLLTACTGADLQNFAMSSLSSPEQKTENAAQATGGQQNIVQQIANALVTQKRMATVITKDSFSDKLFQQKSLEFFMYPDENSSFLRYLEFLNRRAEENLNLPVEHKFTASIIEEADKAVGNKKAYRLKASNDYYSVYAYLLQGEKGLEKHPNAATEILVYKEGKGKNRELLKAYSEQDIQAWMKKPEVIIDIIQKANPKIKK